LTNIGKTHVPHLRRFLGLVALVSALLGGSQGAWATTYIFATFKGDDAAGMKLSIYTSTDSTNFTLLSDTGFGGNTNYIRDPSVMKYTDGKYYIAYTDPMTASCCNPEDHFGIAVSSDLIHWTDLTTVKAGVPAVSRTWAPEWFVEGDGTIKIIANIDTGNQLPDFQPYVFTALDSTLKSWSGPTALGIGADYIDTYVAKLGTTYHAFIKSETTRYLEHATATSLTGPWTFVGKDNWAGWGSGMEGPAIVQLDDGTYKMYVDPQSGGTPCQYMTSSDLNKWSARAGIPGTAGTTIRHGTVIRDTTGFGSNGYFSGAGGSAGTGGSNGTGGASGRGGATGTGGSPNSGGAQVSGGSLATGGAKGSGGSLGTGGSAGPTGVDGSVTGGAGGSATATGGRGGLGSGGTGASSGGATDAGVATGGATGAGGFAGAGGGVEKPDAGATTGGTFPAGGSGTDGFGGMVGVGTGGSIGASGGTSGSGVLLDAGVRETTIPAGCSCAVGGVTSSAAAWLWLPLALAASILTARRRRRR
jgi:MYXO-CTERM domain-containing protein